VLGRDAADSTYAWSMPANTRIPISAIILAALTMVVLLSTIGPATAHSYLNGSNPADGALLAQAPKKVTLNFSDGVRATGLGVTAQGPDGTIGLNATATSKKVTATWPSNTVAGRYVVTYRAVSVDGHVMSGKISFQIAESEGTPTDQGPSQTSQANPDSSSDAIVSQGAEAAASQQAPGSVPVWLLGFGAAILVAGAASLAANAASFSR
jgi:methionine-rich copper-binding protein CopC